MIRFGVSPKKEKELIQWMEKLEVKESDLEERFISARGPGGQHVNHTSTGVYLKHIPSGIEIKSDTARSQSLNRFFARRRLCELLEYKKYGNKSSLMKKINKTKKQKQKRNRRSRNKYQNTKRTDDPD